MVPISRHLLAVAAVCLVHSVRSYTGPAIGLHKFTSGHRSGPASSPITVVPAVETNLTNAPVMNERVGKRQLVRNALRRVWQNVGGILRFTKNRRRVEKNFPVEGRKYELARKQPQPYEIEQELATKYASIESVEERAYQIVLDLGLVKPSA